MFIVGVFIYLFISSRSRQPEPPATGSPTLRSAFLREFPATHGKATPSCLLVFITLQQVMWPLISISQTHLSFRQKVGRRRETRCWELSVRNKCGFRDKQSLSLRWRWKTIKKKLSSWLLVSWSDAQLAVPEAPQPPLWLCGLVHLSRTSDYSSFNKGRPLKIPGKLPQ